MARAETADLASLANSVFFYFFFDYQKDDFRTERAGTRICTS